MERTAPKTLGLERIPAGRLLRVGALAALLSAGVNALVLAGSSSLFGTVVIPPDEAVTTGQVVGASAAGAVGAAVIRRCRTVHPARDLRILGYRGRRSAPFVYPHSLGGCHGIFSGDFGPYARGGCGHRRRSAHEVGPEGVGRVGTIRYLERGSR